MGEGLPIEAKLPLVLARASTLSFSAAFEAILIGIGLGTVIDARLSPQFMWPPDSTMVTNALLPMFGAVGLMLLLALGDGVITLYLRENVSHLIKFEIRRYVRPALLKLLRLGYYAFLACACAAVALWTHVYLWHGHVWPWLFSLLAVFIANGGTVAAKAIFLLDAQRTKPRKKLEWTGIEIVLIAMGAVLAILSAANRFMHWWK
jgi:hypothetical protein